MSAHDDLIALVKTLGRTVHDGDVPASPTYPYLLVSSRQPNYADRALSRDRHGARRSWIITPAGQSYTSVRDMVDLVFSLDGARIQGQRVEVRGVGIDIDEEENLRVNNLPVLFTKIELLLTPPR